MNSTDIPAAKTKGKSTMNIDEIPTFDDTPVQAHPKTAEIEALSLDWMCETGFITTSELRDRWATDRHGAWACYFYPYASFDNAVIYAIWWTWWTYLDQLVGEMECPEWAKLSMDIERVIMSSGDVAPPRDSDSFTARLLNCQAELSRLTAKHSSPGLYRQINVGTIDALYGFTREVYGRQTRTLPLLNGFAPDSEYLQLHRKSVGMLFCGAFMEHAMNFLVPDALRHTRQWQKIIEVGYDIALLHNDLVSYRQEIAESVENANSVYLLHRQEDISLDESVTRVCDVVKRRLGTFLALEEEFPHQIKNLGLPAEGVRQAQHLVANIKTAIQGCLGWYRETTKYIGVAHDLARADGNRQ